MAPCAACVRATSADGAGRDGRAGLGLLVAAIALPADEVIRIAEHGRTGTLAVAMNDMDHLEAFNDREGHAAGDRALIAAAAASLRAEVRDHAYGYRGAEFAVVLREVTPAQAGAALWFADERLSAATRDGRNRVHVDD